MPDHLADGPLPATELAKGGGLNPLSVTRGLRAPAAFGASQKVSPGVFPNTAVSDLYRDRQGSLRNAFLFWGDEHVRRRTLRTDTLFPTLSAFGIVEARPV